MSSISFRSFRNSDPPRLLRLWRQCGLGRGAAQGFPADVFDLLVLAQPYFDPQGLILAWEGDVPVGYVHAGFGADHSGNQLSFDTGIIAMVMVHPDKRRQGIGRELLSRAEAYLRERGARTIQAGESPGRNPFYLGLYGGSDAVGVLQSDVAGDPFFRALGYQPLHRRLVMTKDISQKNDPFDARLVAIRRKVQLLVSDKPLTPTWWWMTHQGRLDSLCFTLQPQGGDSIFSSLTCWGMDFHSLTWGQRTVGLTDVQTQESERRKAYAFALIIEVIRRMRDELITQVEMAIPDNDPASLALCRKLAFQQMDAGIVYAK